LRSSLAALLRLCLKSTTGTDFELLPQPPLLGALVRNM
jgi:hypothetical protein